MTALRSVLGGLLLLSGCNGGVVHPEPGKPNTPEHCGSRSNLEDDCMACSSEPGCGWCENPVSGARRCQPGVDRRTPSTCVDGWVPDSAECAPPPPPPLASSTEG